MPSLDISSPAFQRIVAALRRSPGLARSEIAARAFVGETTLSGGGYLRRMKASGLIYISGWRRSKAGIFSIPLFSLGAAADSPRPSLNDENRWAPGMARLLAAIRDFGPMDYREAAEIAGLSASTVKNAGYLDSLALQGKIHVAGWRRGRGGPLRRVFAFGPGVDAPPPLPGRRCRRSGRAAERQEAAPDACGFVAQIARVHRMQAD